LNSQVIAADVASGPQKRIGRVLGVLILLHLIGGLMLPYILIGTATSPAGAMIDQAAANAAALRTAVALFLAAAALVLAIALSAWPVVRPRGEPLAIVFLALAVANLPLQLVESASVMTILSLSDQLQTAGGDAALRAAGAAAVVARRWAHFTHLLTVVLWMFVLYLILWRTRLVPRALAGLGMIATVMQIAGVPVQAFFGRGLITEMAMPLGPIHLALALWLMVKGIPRV
jgi:hypothetical protein